MDGFKRITSLIGGLALTLALSTSASAQVLTRGPLIQNPDALPTTMTIEWWTSTSGNSTVQYGTTPALGSTVTLSTATQCEIGSAGTCHAVKLTGLTPGTRYYYRLVTNNVFVTDIHYFRTFKAPTDVSELFFTVIGDWGDSTAPQARVALNQTLSDPPLLLTVGDNAYFTGTQSNWDNNAFIPEYSQNILRRAVFMPALGNHDLYDVGADAWSISVQILMHMLPRNGPAGHQEHFYSFDNGDAHFVVLDSNPESLNATQTNWLAADLAATTRRWKFVFLHHTPYSCANGLAAFASDMDVRNMWGPVFEQYGVDVVFAGHDHLYERTGLVDDYLVGGAPGHDGKATRYITTGGGGEDLDETARVDGMGPYSDPPTGSRIYCYWLDNDCPTGPDGQYCSFSRFQHLDVRLQGNTTLTIKAIDEFNAPFDELVLTKPNICGNSVTEGGEQCDLGASNGAAGSCCTSACQFAASSLSCRASAGTCDPAEMCTGSSATCPANQLAPASLECRASAGDCDVAETCTGNAAACPSDAFAPSSAGCRASAGICDVIESCTGTSATCPANGFAASSTVCRGSIDACDAAETCTGSSATCPNDAVAGTSTVCRASAGGCDPAETCNGSATFCPPDAIAPAETVCRPAFSVCDVAETCNGFSPACPTDVFNGAGIPCRTSQGVCDLPESCTGSSAACPTDTFRPVSFGCRSATDVCDQAETCTGSSATCPNDQLSPPTAVCRAAAGPCDPADTCTGSSAACPPSVLAPNTTVCRAAAGACDVQEKCTGAAASCPTDVFVAGGTSCRSVAGVCDVTESCTGSTPACPNDTFLSSANVCRAVADVCDKPESCTGSASSCPADTFLTSQTVCRTATGACGKAETCTGSAPSCPADFAQSAGVECRPAAGDCDVAEACNGTDITCPPDAASPDGDGDGHCDLVDDCPAAGNPDQLDADGDGDGDVCDPCSNYVPVYAERARLQLSRLATGPGDDALKFTGQMTLPEAAAIDPATSGMRLMVTGIEGETILDASIPAGTYDRDARAGWKASGSGTAFTYLNKGQVTPPIQGITKISVKKGAAGVIKFSISGRDGSYPAGPDDLPLFATVIFDPPHASTNRCGEAIFGTGGTDCSYSSAGAIKCQ